jgi:hypothetical protein
MKSDSDDRLPAVFMTIGVFLSLVGCGSVVNSYEDTAVAAKPDLAREALRYYLPVGKIEVDCAWSKDTNAFAFTISPLIQPENDVPHWVRRKSNPFFDDTITITVNSKGLLQTANAVSQDQTTAIAAALISAAGSALTFGAGLNPSLAAEKKAKPPSPPNADDILPSAFQVLLKPRDSTTLSPWLEIPNGDGKRRIAVLYQIHVTSYANTSRMSPRRSRADAPYDGIIVRLNNPYKVTVKQIAMARRPLAKKDDTEKKDSTSASPSPSPSPPTEPDEWKSFGIQGPGKETVVLVPDAEHSYVLPLARTPTVKNETDVALVDGTVQTLAMTRPSIGLGIASVPKTILDALAPIPLSIRQSVTNNVQAIDNRLKAEADIKKLQSQ